MYNNARTKYIHNLTDEDIKEIARLCFENDEEVDHTWMSHVLNGWSDNILVVSKEDNEFQIYDLRIVATHGYRKKENADDLFSNFMYKKFGEQYLNDYADRIHMVSFYGGKAHEADKIWQMAKQISLEHIERIKNL